VGLIAALEKQIADCEERELKYIDRFTRLQVSIPTVRWWRRGCHVAR
jgi:hypothetical protein